LAAVDEALRVQIDNGRASAGRDCVNRLRTTFASAAAFLGLGLALAGCATAPADTENERLDTNTGTTVTVMPKPVELIVERSRGTKTDPFAYVAPFETNRMGSHELFLWVSAPQVAGTLGVPQVFCGDVPIALEKHDGTIKDMGLSTPPYKVPAPWSAQWYFKLSGEVLDCFAGAMRIRVITQAAGETEPDTYAADGPAISGLGTFVSKVRT
jgi:hypothetical protein